MQSWSVSYPLSQTAKVWNNWIHKCSQLFSLHMKVCFFNISIWSHLQVKMSKLWRNKVLCIAKKWVVNLPLKAMEMQTIYQNRPFIFDRESLFCRESEVIVCREPVWHGIYFKFQGLGALSDCCTFGSGETGSGRLI